MTGIITVDRERYKVVYDASTGQTVLRITQKSFWRGPGEGRSMARSIALPAYELKELIKDLQLVAREGG